MSVWQTPGAGRIKRNRLARRNSIVNRNAGRQTDYVPQRCRTVSRHLEHPTHGRQSQASAKYPVPATVCPSEKSLRGALARGVASERLDSD